jgi:tRNA(Ile)-lysidine synthase
MSRNAKPKNGATPVAPDPNRMTPVAAVEFAAAMAALGPFERRPRLAIAVSGGPDSMALLLLCQEWAKARHGTVTALTVDHGLRREAAAEAKRVAGWARQGGIAHVTLKREGPKPRGDIQAQAREARYRLLENWCAEHAVFHLLLAHHLEDQAETFLLRLARGSGLDGLAAMAPVAERAGCRLLRPLLGIARARLAATGQESLTDPSNDNTAFARVRLRRSQEILAAEGLSAERLAGTATSLARARQALELGVAQLLARAAMPHPAGYIRLDPQVLAEAPAEIGLRALAAIVMAVSGAPFPPRFERLMRLHGELCAGLKRGRTLGGCRIVPKGGAILVCREAAAMAPPIAAKPGEMAVWDGRYRLRLPTDAPKGLRLSALGPGGPKRETALPAFARAVLPALRDGKGVVAVPAINYIREGGPILASDVLRLRTTRPATGAGIKVA